jgi:3-isopropylmalate dehydratase small subunit
VSEAEEVSAPPEPDELATLRGRAWSFGDCVGADAILPPPYHSLPHHELARFVMHGVDPLFAGAFKPGDFVVAGIDFAAGTVREVTAIALQQARVAAVIARSYAAGFLQAATRIGLPALIIEETGAIKAGDRLRVDIETRKIVNLSSGDRYVIRQLDDAAVHVLRAGGLIEYRRLNPSRIE